MIFRSLTHLADNVAIDSEFGIRLSQCSTGILIREVCYREKRSARAAMRTYTHLILGRMEAIDKYTICLGTGIIYLNTVQQKLDFE
jgi:hypothetical protein